MDNLPKLNEILKQGDKNARPSQHHENLARSILLDLGIDSNKFNLVVMAYFLKYGYIPLSERAVSESGKYLGSAPWIGLEGAILEPSINLLLERGILEFSHSNELDNQLVLRLNPKPHDTGKVIQQVFSKVWGNTKHNIARRKKIVTDMGWTHNTRERNRLKDALEHCPRDVTIKIMAYHGRTWLPSAVGVSGFLLDLARERPDINFEMLIVGKNASGRVVEGATKQEHIGSTAFGIPALRKVHLPKDIPNRFDVRAYGKTTRNR